MPGIIKPEDIFDFQGYHAQLEALDAAGADWAQHTLAWLQRIRAAYQEAARQLIPLKEDLAKLSVTKDGADRQLVDYIQKIGQVGAKLETARKAEKDLTEAQQLNGQVVTELTAKLASLFQRYQALDPTQKDYQKQQKAILQEVNTVTRAIEAQSKALQVAKSTIVAAENSYLGLKKQTADLKKQLDSLDNAYDRTTGKINQNNRAAVALNQQYQKNISLLTKIEQGQRVYSRNVGNYPSVGGAVGGLAGKAVGTTLALAGLDTGVAALQKIGEVTLQFDSLDSALKVVSNDTAVFTQRQAMLQRVSDDLGQDLSVVEKSYTNLTASSKGTRLEGEATDKIFTSVVGTMGRLKKSTEDTDGALLAIAQMMSKGTIQSEELRGQLGERIPGAFNIMARALGVTTTKLGDMLKNGEVLASEALPKFAAELEKTFNPNHERRVEGLAANLARLRNEGVEWVKSLDIGDKLGQFIGLITSASRSVRNLFSDTQLSAQAFADQSDKVNSLESSLAPLLSRYDELQSKSSLTAKEQKELQGIVNEMAGIVPAAATGFDQYGNALDVNKSKVMAFAQAQRELNAELNKQVIAELKTDAYKNIGRINANQLTLQRGKETQHIGMGVNIEANVNPQRAKQLADQNKQYTQEAIASARKLMAAGGEVDGALRGFIERSGDFEAKQLLLIDDYNKKIAQKQAEAAVAFQRGEKSKWEATIKEATKLKDQLNKILYPTTATQSTANDKPQVKQSEIDKRLREALGKSQAGSEQALASLSNQRQDGLLDEQTFIEQRLKLTLEGLAERQALLEKYGKQETKDYLAIQQAKLKADTDYKRAQLQLDLKTSKSNTDAQVSAIEVQHGEGGLSAMDYVEQRHKALQAGLERELAILKEAGQAESQLYRDTQTRLTEEQTDYLRKRLKAEQKAWNEELEQTKDAVKAVNATLGADYQEKLQALERYYAEKQRTVQLDVAKGKLTPTEGEAQLYALQLAQLQESLRVTEETYHKDSDLSKGLYDSKIEQLKNYRDYAMLNAQEMEAANKAIAELEKARDAEQLELKKKFNKEQAENGMQQSDLETDHELKNIEKAKQKRDELLKLGADFASKLGETTFALVSGNYERESQQLEAQHDNELKLAGDNADAKQKIEENYAKRKAELARKQAIADREQALFNIALSTAMGVASVLSTGGGTHYADLGISAGILTAFVIATGALEAAAVLAKPLPAYKDGKLASDTYSGLALAGEAGAELLIDREGYSQVFDKPTLFTTQPGDRVFTATETAALMASWRQPAMGDSWQQAIQWNQQTADTLQRSRQAGAQLSVQQAMATAPAAMTPRQFQAAFLAAWEQAPRQETHIDFEGMKEGIRRHLHWQERVEKRNRFW
ncbi:tape measure protein [Spirosoma sp. SC4-14]|uniref:tape measure protein n=1 Tax=Spirosoma sp. SC4-14 TaxID=3128900 RepID=UPI0030CDECC5